MVETTLLASAFVGLATAGLYAYVGVRVSRRELRGTARGANQAFVLWWMALAGLTGTGATQAAAAGFGFTSLQLHLALAVAIMVALFVSLWGLGYYLAYLFTGRVWTGPLLATFYGIYLTSVLFLMWDAHPAGVDVGKWSASVHYADDLIPAGSESLFVLVLLLPQVVGALAYASLYFRVEARSQRYRIAIVSGTILIWFGSSILAAVLGYADWIAWPLLSRLIGLLAAAAILAAFSPPAWVQRRWGIDPVG